MTKIQDHSLALKKSDDLRPLILALVITIILVLFLIWRFLYWYYDDPFITFRYAWNLIHGQGFVYNPGERVLSTTTPLFTLIIAGLGFFLPDIPSIGTLIGCVCTGLCGLLFWDITRQWKMSIASWVGLLLIPIFPLLDSTISSEIPLYIALALATIDLYLHHAYRWTAVFASLLVLTRPDGIILPVLLAVHFLFTKYRPIPWKAALIFLAITSAWFGFAWLYFGSPLPVTLMVKQQQGLLSVNQHFAPGLLSMTIPYEQKWVYILEAVLALVGVIWLMIKRHPSMLLLTWTAAYFLAYSLLGVNRYYWYYAPLVPGFILLVASGLEAISELFKYISRWRFIHPWSARAVFTFLAVIVGFQGLDTYTNSLTPDSRYPVYRAIGEWLNQNTSRNDTVGTLEIGIIGYFADRPVVDFAGLVCPEVAEQMKPGSTYEDAARWTVSTYQPAYVVVRQNGFPELRKGYLTKQCNMVQAFTTENYAINQDMVIYYCPGEG